ncbi:ABC transporter permease subunit [Paenibacillus campi]|uniref:ABC transporter permease subunit n=1 Tax=Paenibacillus campi TaxID=3106031 RepID=UPI002AFFEF39|nr:MULTISPECIES: ABC transporter permease subunit [unclassified Paenibacillus]
MNIVIGMTWKELTRKKVLLLTLILTILFLIVFWFIANTITARSGNTLEDFTIVQRFMNASLLLSIGFFFGNFILAFLVIFSSFSAISGEAEVGIMQAALTRPLKRWQWYIGRWFGYVLFGWTYALVLYLSIIGVTAMHATIPGDLLTNVQSFALFALSVPILVTVSLLGSTAFSAIGNGVLMTMLYGAGWLGGMVEKVTGTLQLKPDVQQTMNNITGIISLIMPVDAIQRKSLSTMLGMEQLAGMLPGGRLGLTDIGLGQIPSASFIVYALVYMLVLLYWGIHRFQRKDL